MDIFIAVFIPGLVAMLLSMNELKKNHKEVFDSIGGNRAFFWPTSQMLALGFFLAFSYRELWSKLGIRPAFVITSISLWFCCMYVISNLVAML